MDETPRGLPPVSACPGCGRRDFVFIIDSRAAADTGYVRRRRKCEYCFSRWTTYEVSADIFAEVRRVQRAVVKLKGISDELHKLIK